MLIITLIWIAVAAVVLLSTVFLAARCKNRLANIESIVWAEKDKILKRASAIDVALAEQLIAGHPLTPAIKAWGKARAAVLETGRTEKPETWDSDDLAAWKEVRCSKKAGAEKNAFFVTSLSIVIVLLVLGSLSSLAYYHLIYAPRFVEGVSPASSPASLLGSTATDPSLDPRAGTWNSASSAEPATALPGATSAAAQTTSNP